VWDKLQSKELTRVTATDGDFEVLDDFFIGTIMGGNHEYMNTLMTQRLGEDGERAMHIAMGKRISGCDTSVVLPKGAEYFTPMMGMGMGGEKSRADMRGNTRGGMTAPMMGTDYGYRGGYGHLGGGYGVLGSLAGLAVFIFLVLGSIY